MAKGVEDTACYRLSGPLAFCEVGGDPSRRRHDATARWHARAAARVAGTGHGLVPGTTHDTKRAQDVRSRLYALSEMAGPFGEGLRALRDALGARGVPVDDMGFETRVAAQLALDPFDRARPLWMFTLVEGLVAFVVLMIVLGPTASLPPNSIGQAASARERLTALSLAEQYLELLNNTPFGAANVNKTPTFPALPKMGSLILQKSHTVRSSVAYTILAEFHWASGQGVADLCTSGLTPKVIDVQVTVRWSNSTRHITDTTVINYPPAGLTTYGFLAVQVNGDPASGPPNDANGRTWASRVLSVPVEVRSLPGTTPATTTTVYPNSQGCVFHHRVPGN